MAERATEWPKPRALSLKLKFAIGVLPFLVATAIVFWIFSLATLAEQIQQSKNNLQQINSAIRKYLGENKKLPAVVYNKEGKPLHSWRVLLLPYLGENQLYKEFKLNEPWDSPHNKPLLQKIPKVYVPPRPGMTAEPFSTFYQVFDGYWNSSNRNGDWREWAGREINTELLHWVERRTAFVSDKRFGLQSFFPPQNRAGLFVGEKDLSFAVLLQYGTGNIFTVFEAGEAVPWTKPVDLYFHLNRPLPKLGGLFGGSFHAVRMDGRMEYLHLRKENEKEIRDKIAKTYTYGEGDW
jgi:hypothetical protein